MGGVGANLLVIEESNHAHLPERRHISVLCISVNVSVYRRCTHTHTYMHTFRLGRTLGQMVGVGVSGRSRSGSRMVSKAGVQPPSPPTGTTNRVRHGRTTQHGHQPTWCHPQTRLADACPLTSLEPHTCRQWCSQHTKHATLDVTHAYAATLTLRRRSHNTHTHTHTYDATGQTRSLGPEKCV